MEGKLEINMKTKASIKTEMRALGQCLYQQVFISSIRSSLTNSPSEPSVRKVKRKAFPLHALRVPGG